MERKALVDIEIYNVLLNENQLLKEQIKNKDNEIIFLQETIKNIWRQKDENKN